MCVQPADEQLNQLNKALRAAYDYDELKRLVTFAFGEELAWFTPVTGKRDLTTVVAELVVETLESLPLEFPSLSSDETARLGEMRAALESEAPTEQDDASVPSDVTPGGEDGS